MQNQGLTEKKKAQTMLVKGKNQRSSSQDKKKLSCTNSPYQKYMTKGSSPNLIHLSPSVTDLINKTRELNYDLSILHEPYSNYPIGVKSLKSYSGVKAYAANSYPGIIRNYNEDRIVIIPHVKKPKTFTGKIWPKVGYFAVYDGHAGVKCADFLKQNLHNYIFQDSNFPTDIKTAIKNGFLKAEKEYETIAVDSLNQDILEDDSGSCACVILFVDNHVFTANVGDSRIILSLDHGKIVRPLTTDHKPNVIKEYNRIIKSGGKVYCDYQKDNYNENNNYSNYYSNNNEGLTTPQSHKVSNSFTSFVLPKIARTRSCNFGLPKIDNQKINMPEKNNLNAIYRIRPSTLSVSRTIGDFGSKLSRFGGVPGMIICEPEINAFEYPHNADFILLACDGIFDVLDSEECGGCAWNVINNEKNNELNGLCLNCVDMVIKTAMYKKSTDNLSSVFIAMENLEKYFHTRISREHLITNQIKKVPNNFSNVSNLTIQKNSKMFLKSSGILCD